MPRLRVLPFVLASVVSAAIVLAAPFIGEIRRAILARFPDRFGQIIGGVVLLAVGAAIVSALARIRDRRAWRYTAIAIALAIAGTYALVTRTGDPRVDSVERFHFVEYGLITFLFYRAWRPAGDLSTVVLTVLAGLLVGTIEEWFQWFIPARIGDVRDVFLNGVAIGCGLIFAVALDPPDRFAAALTPAARRRIGVFAAVWILVFAGFFQSVALGNAVSGEGWTFKSGYTAAALDQQAAERAQRWRGTFVDRPKRLSAEDQYMTEGLWHVQQRNNAWTAGDVRAAWNENLILERYFAPVLDTPSYVSKTGHRWSPAHRADAEKRVAAAAGRTAHYESRAEPAAIHVWPRRVYWSAVGLAALLLVLPAVLGRRKNVGRELTV